MKMAHFVAIEILALLTNKSELTWNVIQEYILDCNTLRKSVDLYLE